MPSVASHGDTGWPAVVGEAARRAQYERLYAEVREAKRALEAALMVGTDAAEVRRLRDHLRRLSSALRAWQLGAP